MAAKQSTDATSVSVPQSRYVLNAAHISDRGRREDVASCSSNTSVVIAADGGWC
jgi:hypothetical protein